MAEWLKSENDGVDGFARGIEVKYWGMSALI